MPAQAEFPQENQDHVEAELRILIEETQESQRHQSHMERAKRIAMYAGELVAGGVVLGLIGITTDTAKISIIGGVTGLVSAGFYAMHAGLDHTDNVREFALQRKKLEPGQA
jgi:hypothetical protein